MVMPPARPARSPENIREEFHPAPGAFWSATAAVVATYVFFLAFAQFGFPKLLQAAGAGGAEKLLLAVMGGAGIAASVVAARYFSEPRCRRAMIAGFVACLLAAGSALAARSTATFGVVAALTGAGTGIVTVTLATILRRVVGGERLGFCVGCGTGIAYGVCNIPAIFTGSGPAQAVVAILAASLGLLATQGLELRAPRETAPPGNSGMTLVIWTTLFLALVCFDSAAFFIIQHNPRLSIAGWTGAGQLWANAAMHVLAGVGASFLLDRRRVGGVVFLGAMLIAGGCVLIGRVPSGSALGALLYVAGVSGYSAGLVFYPARSGNPMIAATIYCVAGWIGSAVGLVIAADRTEIPWWLTWGAVGVVATALILAGAIRNRGSVLASGASVGMK
jgi:cytochrome c oxidase cbb3-type subunit 2